MAWERRRNGRRYYYQSRRQADGRVAKVYLGSGRRAELNAQRLAELNAKREVELAELHAVQASLASLDGLTAEVRQDTDLLATATLLAHGLHQHRGEWRRKREH